MPRGKDAMITAMDSEGHGSGHVSLETAVGQPGSEVKADRTAVVDHLSDHLSAM